MRFSKCRKAFASKSSIRWVIQPGNSFMSAASGDNRARNTFYFCSLINWTFKKCAQKWQHTLKKYYLPNVTPLKETNRLFAMETSWKCVTSPSVTASRVMPGSI